LKAEHVHNCGDDVDPSETKKPKREKIKIEYESPTKSEINNIKTEYESPKKSNSLSPAKNDSFEQIDCELKSQATGVDSKSSLATVKIPRVSRRIKVEGVSSTSIPPKSTICSRISVKAKVNVEVKRLVKEEEEEKEKVKGAMKWEPADWMSQLDNIREMRRGRDAAVDTMGCDKIFDVYADPPVNILFRL